MITIHWQWIPLMACLFMLLVDTVVERFDPNGEFYILTGALAAITIILSVIIYIVLGILFLTGYIKFL